MILEDLLKLLCISHCHIEVRSAYNDKLLCKKFPSDKQADLLSREVVACRPEIRCNKELAWPVMFIYLHGDVELEGEMQRKKAKCNESNLVDQRE